MKRGTKDAGFHDKRGCPYGINNILIKFYTDLCSYTNALVFSKPRVKL